MHAIRLQRLAHARSSSPRAGGEHPLGQRPAERRGLLGVARDAVAHPLGAVGKPGESEHRQLVAVEAGADADRRVAGGVERRDRGALGGQLHQRIVVV